ncbi:hypothetical protein GCM10018793_01000 [Streptomyces sulfonofaciens]|uniref:DUF2771 domain-containing protein n=1 Tax=Streptomyces sulfonofaciens TaxID=68272 RepID=A0A919FN13_9ACTN|nr:DUF2771 domain-containing protein [Streptomyces sulfonofaciens]GHH69083.1 hypothetical protein GCM10018793_01000 [Streptomyces sulfonofaciens]
MTSPPPAEPRPPRAPHPAPSAHQDRRHHQDHQDHQHRPGRAARTASAACTLCAALLALSGCDKPTPLATVTVGEDSVHTEAACYNDGRPVPAADFERCLRETDHHRIGVDPDATVRFGVDPQIADRGWVILLNGRALTGTSGKTYRTVPGSVFFDPQFGARGGSATVSVLEGSGSRPIGLWSFTFEQS